MARIQVYELEDLANMIDSVFGIDTKYSRQTLNPWIIVYDTTRSEAQEIADEIEAQGLYSVSYDFQSGAEVYFYIK